MVCPQLFPSPPSTLLQIPELQRARLKTTGLKITLVLQDLKQSSSETNQELQADWSRGTDTQQHAQAGDKASPVQTTPGLGLERGGRDRERPLPSQEAGRAALTRTLQVTSRRRASWEGGPTGSLLGIEDPRLRKSSAWPEVTQCLTAEWGLQAPGTGVWVPRMPILMPSACLKFS